MNGLNALNPLNRRLVGAIAGALFLYVLAIRTYDVGSTFLMLGEQTRDWMVALGKIAWDAWMKLLVSRGEELPRPRPRFEHGATWARNGLTLFGVYHPSRQNTNTGVLTPKMYDAVFNDVVRCLR